jgi:hypothetical protein
MSTFALGQKVVVEDQNGVIEKIMKSSAKVNFDGKVRIVPFSLIEDDGSSPAPAAPAASRRREAPAAPAKPAAGKAAPAPAKKQKGYTIPQEDLDEANEVDKSEPGAPEEKKHYENRNDNTAKFLSEFDDPVKMYNAVMRHEAHAFLNKDAMANLKPQLSKINTGLVRMRLGNMLRSAIKKAKSAK